MYDVQIGSNDSPDVGCSDRGHAHHYLLTVSIRTEQDVRDTQVALPFIYAYGYGSVIINHLIIIAGQTR